MFSYDFVMAEHSGAVFARTAVERLERPVILDANTVRFTLKEPYFGGFRAAAFELAILPKHIYSPHLESEQAGIDYQATTHELVGSGPYALVDRQF